MSNVITIEIKFTRQRRYRGRGSKGVYMHNAREQGVSYRDAHCRVHRAHVAPTILIVPIKRWLYQCRRHRLSQPRPGVDQTDRYELFPSKWSANRDEKLSAPPLFIVSLVRAKCAGEVVNWWPPNKLCDNRASFMLSWYLHILFLLFSILILFFYHPTRLFTVSVNSSVIEGWTRGWG